MAAITTWSRSGAALALWLFALQTALGQSVIADAPPVSAETAATIPQPAPYTVAPEYHHQTICQGASSNCRQPRGNCNNGSGNSGPLENVYLFGGFDGARGPDDLGINANVGGRIGIQSAFPIIEDLGLGVQLGGAANYHRTATRFQRLNGGPGERQQLFSTLGVFQRSESGLIWAIAYDMVHTESYADLDMSQWRGLLGFRVDPCNEFGVWGTYRDRGDSAIFAGEAFSFQAINQANLYYTRYWETGAMTKVWIGVAEEHGRAILGIPGDTPIYHAFVYGAEFIIPLSCNFAILAEANLITPNDSGTVNAFVGLAWFPGASALTSPRSQFAPVLPVANNANFSIDARR